jgi:hypothetical protein
MRLLFVILSLILPLAGALADSEDPERMSDEEKCEERFASLTTPVHRKKICGEAILIGYSGFERCLDVFNSEWKAAVADFKAVKAVTLEAATHCRFRNALTNPKLTLFVRSL